MAAADDESNGSRCGPHDKRSLRAMRPLVESLESRHLLAASLSASFAVNPPAVLSPAIAATVAVRVQANQAMPAGTAIRISLYASPGAQLSPQSVLLGQKTRSIRLTPHGALFPLRFSESAALPSGQYYLIAKVQPADVRFGGSAVDAAALRPTMFFAPLVDLSGQIVKQPPEAIFVGPQSAGRGNVSVLVFNAGNVPAIGPLSITLYASQNAVFQSGAPIIGVTAARNVSIAGGRSQIFVVRFALPPGTPAGSYHLFGLINSSNGIAESNLANNLAASLTPLTTTNVPPVGAFEPSHRHHESGPGALEVSDYGNEDVLAFGATAADLGGSSDYNVYAIDSSASSEPTTAPTTTPTTDPSSSDSAGSSGGDSAAGSASDGGPSSGGDSTGGSSGDSGGGSGDTSG